MDGRWRPAGSRHPRRTVRGRRGCVSQRPRGRRPVVDGVGRDTRVSLDCRHRDAGSRHVRRLGKQRARRVRRRLGGGGPRNRQPRVLSCLPLDRGHRHGAHRRPRRRNGRGVQRLGGRPGDRRQVYDRHGRTRLPLDCGRRHAGSRHARGFGSAAFDVSDNGSVVVGESNTSSGLRAFAGPRRPACGT